MKINIWHNVEQCTVNAFIDKWHAQLQTCICVKGGQLNML